MPPRYQTVYDVAVELLPHPAYLVLSVMLLLAGVLRLVYRTRKRKAKGLGWIMVVFAVGFGLVTCLMPMWDMHVLKEAERQGAAFVAEGPITGLTLRRDTVPGPKKELRTRESFIVANVRFSYVREHDEAGFHNGGRRPLDLYDGLPVRVTYLPKNGSPDSPNRILRFEIIPEPQRAGKNEYPRERTLP